MSEVTLTSLVASSYVRELSRSQVFYQALGFTVEGTGRSDLSAWSYLRNGDYYVLLVTSQPPLIIPELPLHFYFFVDDLSRATRQLADIGVVVEDGGYPPHALGGEARTVDPDGNTILLGQREKSDSQADLPDQDPVQHFSLLREAAALAQHRAGAAQVTCQVGDRSGGPCPRQAEVKLADSWGDTAWACIPHAEEALITASGAYIANYDAEGLGAFMAARRSS